MMELAERIARLSPQQRDVLLQWMETEHKPHPRPVESSLPTLSPKPQERYEPFPLTAVQEVYWMGRSGLYDLGVGGTNIYQSFKVLGPFEEAIARLEHALQRLIEHHEILRMVFLSAEGTAQRVLPEAPPYRIEVVDLRGVGEEAKEAAVAQLREELCTKVGSIDRWPLFDLVAQRLEDGHFHLHTRFEPFLMDGEGRMQLVRELFQLFEDPQAELASVGCSYRDYASAWRHFAATVTAQRSRAYWLERLPNLPAAPELPLAHPVDPRTPARFGRRAIVLEPEAWRRLKRRAGQAGLTPSMVVIATFAEVIRQVSGSRRYTLGTIGNYRPPIHPDIHHLMGNFNTISLLEVDGRPATFLERAKEIQRQNTADLEHPYFSGFEILRELNRTRRPSSRATIPVWFNSVVEYSHPSHMRDTGGFEASGDAGTIRFLDLIMHPPQALLLGTAYEREEGTLTCVWQAVEEAFPEGLIDEMSKAFGRLLRRLALEPELWTVTAASLSGFEAPREPPDAIRVLGYRVDPRQVEALLEAHPAVQAALVRGERVGVDNRGLVAFVVPWPGEPPPTPAQLRLRLDAELPYYMVPLSFVLLEELPRQPDGSPDRETLAGLPVAVIKDEDSAFQGALEERLAELWEEILGVRPERHSDSFFDLGGDSLSLVRLVGRVREVLGCELSLSCLFQGGTVGDMARFADRPSD